ncbi:MAG: response regulator [Proteobacteria bacterium]|nr:response regulator [Pseudomonadota bacterium]
MAAAFDPGALDPGAAPRPRLSWLVAIGAGLLVALVVTGFVQWRQHAMLRQAVSSSEDMPAVLVFQAESEYRRLREAWLRAAGHAPAPDRDALMLRYEIWVSRIDLLDSPNARRLIRADAESVRTVQRIRATVAAIDAALAAAGPEGPDRALVQQLWPALDALGAPVHAMTMSVTHSLAAASAERMAAVRAQNQLGLGLIIFLGVLTIAFALVAMRHVRQLRERQRVLEQLAASLRQARREAESASEAKSAFLANMSHEIRTPFHGLMGMLSLLRETGLTPRQIDYLRTATESADHLLAIVNDVLDMSQLESGRMTLAPGALELRALLRDVEALMRPQAHAKQLTLHLHADPGVPERIVADATRVKQILFNLLSNAIKFCEQGAVALDVHRLADVHGRALLEFVVSDTGIGMSDDTIARLFRRFEQGDSSTSRRHGGTGLGLEISRNLARLMDGDITVRSRPGEGSVFTFQMPLLAAEEPAAAPRPAAPAGDAAARALDVLVAEDHPVNRQYMAALLDNLGHRAHFTANGEEAVQAARERRFDVVLMDLHMPLLDGAAATRAIRALADPKAAAVPIVALTADAFPETRERCLIAGMNDYLTKPVSPSKLAATLRRLFGAAAGVCTDATPAPTPSPDGQAPLIDENTVAMALQVMPRERLAAMVETFLAQGPATVLRLRSAVRDGQPLDLRVNAHAAKGAALNLGLAALAAVAEALHEGASHLPAHEIARLVQRFEDLLTPTRHAAAALGLADRRWKADADAVPH